MDMHVHSDNSHDAHHSVTLVCEKAVAKGLRAIAVTDHCNIIDYYKDKQNIICRQAAFEVKKAADVFNGQLIVSSGIELGSPARDCEAVKDVLKNNFDFVAASVHRIKGKKKSFRHYDYNRETNSPENLIARYFDEILETVQWNGFDTLAHLTFPLRYFPAEKIANFDIWQFRDRIEEILKTLAQNGKALEINTNYFFKARIYNSKGSSFTRTTQNMAFIILRYVPSMPAFWRIFIILFPAKLMT